MTGPRRYPMRLQTKDGVRRLELLGHLIEAEVCTMEDMTSKLMKEDLRWLWDKDLVRITSSNPMRYEVSDMGHATYARGEEIRDIEEKQAA